MAFPSTGINHINAVKSEEQLVENYKTDLEKIYLKNIKDILHKGGTQHKEDNVLIFTDNVEKKVSLKQKMKGLKVGSFDYVNTSSFPKSIAPNSFKVYDEFRGSKDVRNYDKLKEAINDDLNNIDDNFITDFFQKNVLDKYDDIDLIIIDELEKKLYKLIPECFSLIMNGGKLRVKKSNKISMSRRIIGIDKNGNEVDNIYLRIRLHLNNGKTKWLNSKSSNLVIKFQQDSVEKMI